MTLHFEEMPAVEGDTVAHYLHQMTEYVINQQPSQLEEHLLEPHPMIPGELEAYQYLKKTLARPLRVQLDDSGNHVIPIISQ